MVKYALLKSSRAGVVKINAAVGKLVDPPVLEAGSRKGLRVRVSPAALHRLKNIYATKTFHHRSWLGWSAASALVPMVEIGAREKGLFGGGAGVAESFFS